MRLSNESLQYMWTMPPMLTKAVNSGTGQYLATGPTVLAATTAPVVVDLTTICGTGAKASVPVGAEDYDPNPIGHFLYMQADGDDIYYCFGSDVTTIGTISPTAVSTVTANLAVTTFTATGCLRLPQGILLPYKLPVGSPPPGSPQDNADVGRYSPARFLAFRTNTLSSSCYLRLFQVSP